VVTADGEQRVLPTVPRYRIRVRSASADPDRALAEVRAELDHQLFSGLDWPMFEVRVTALDGGAAIVHLSLDALVLDLAVLGPHGWSYLEALCGQLPGVGIVVCTGRSSVGQRVRGLRLGVDDWVTKPCHPEEVLARVEGALRARQAAAVAAESAGPVVAGELEIRPDMFEAFVGGRSLGLTRREFELLVLLAASQGRVIPRERIYERVWGYQMAHGDRSVDVFVRKLRRKLEAASPGWHYVHTHFGVGYRFDAHEAGDEDEDSPEASATVRPPEG